MGISLKSKHIAVPKGLRWVGAQLLNREWQNMFSVLRIACNTIAARIVTCTVRIQIDSIEKGRFVWRTKWGFFWCVCYGRLMWTIRTSLETRTEKSDRILNSKLVLIQLCITLLNRTAPASWVVGKCSSPGCAGCLPNRCQALRQETLLFWRQVSGLGQSIIIIIINNTQCLYCFNGVTD